MHACVLRQVSNTLKDSVFSQILWAISSLGLDDEFDYIKSPLEITRKKTGQKIYFRGADDENKIKSIKPSFGYIGILWFEELDQFKGEEAVRKTEQSVIRGGDTAFKFKSFNPPKSAQNWANKYIKIPRADRLVTESTYFTVPEKWLGKPFLDDAAFLKEINPIAYENEYMGVANGTGGNVFDNIVIKEVKDDEINKREPEVVSPVSTMKQAFLEALKESEIGNGNTNIVIEASGNESEFIKYLTFKIKREEKRQGTNNGNLVRV